MVSTTEKCGKGTTQIALNTLGLIENTEIDSLRRVKEHLLKSSAQSTLPTKFGWHRINNTVPLQKSTQIKVDRALLFKKIFSSAK